MAESPNMPEEPDPDLDGPASADEPPTGSRRISGARKSKNHEQKDRLLHRAGRHLRMAEQARVQATQPDQMEAEAVWRALPSSAQMMLARETVETRRHELLRAHRDLVAVGYGHRTTGEKAAEIKSGEPCIVFTVKRKWSKKKSARNTARNTLPRHLEAFVDFQGARRFCAIPTDVRGLNQLGDVLPHGNQMVHAQSDPYWSFGMGCCAVRLNEGKRYLLGCHHVLALSEVVQPVPDQVNVLSAASRQKYIGRLSGYFGVVNPDGTFIDAALAEIDDLNDLNDVVLEPPPNGRFVQDAGELAHLCIIRAAGHVEIPARFVTVHYDYPLANWGALGTVTLPVLVEIQSQSAPAEPGDSGSPVFDETGSVFQGMHIGGTDDGRAYFIPAFELLRASNYGMSGGDEMLRLA
jgi:hypothetical protein